MISSRNKEKFENYEGFVEKFKPKKTTDDCYTPPEVYEVIKNWAVKEYGIDEAKIVRPFYPGGDYKNYDYSGEKIVVDNPPFSILKEIKDFYCKNNIKFFLFAPHLTLFSSNDDKSICYILTNTPVIYENGANVKTSFVTNLDEYRIRLVPELKRKIEEIQKTNKNSLPKYQYPNNVISAASLGKYVNAGIEMRFKYDELYSIRALDSQRKHKKEIFGSGYLISDKKAAGIKAAGIKVAEEKIVWELSEREKDIIKKLN